MFAPESDPKTAERVGLQEDAASDAQRLACAGMASQGPSPPPPPPPPGGGLGGVSNGGPDCPGKLHIG